VFICVAAGVAAEARIRFGFNSRLLVAEARAHRHALAANRAATAQHCCPALGLHARAETVRLHPFPAIWLKCALWHRNALLFPCSFLLIFFEFLLPSSASI
jgi:hypothetical protein